MITDGIRVRVYEPADRDRFLSLYRNVWGKPRERDWFEWRFEENPYREGVQMVVAEEGDELVGVEPLLPFRLRARSRTVDAYQPVDWMVHPDHRRRGIFTRMTEYLFERYADDASLFFNFPTKVLLPGLDKFDWRVVGQVPMRCRIQNPEHFLSKGGNDLGVPTSVARSAVSTIGAASMWAIRLLDRTVSRPDDVTVDRYAEVPVETLGDIYASNVPERIHLARDDGYLRWRFANPRWETSTYVASRDGTPVSSVVTATSRRDDLDLVYLLDVQPMTSTDEVNGALRALLGTVVSEHADADLLKAPAGLHPEVFRRFSFVGEVFPLSRMTNTQTHVVRPLGSGAEEPTTPEEDTWQLDRQELTDPDDWLLTPADIDFE